MYHPKPAACVFERQLASFALVGNLIYDRYEIVDRHSPLVYPAGHVLATCASVGFLASDPVVDLTSVSDRGSHLGGAL